MRKKVKISKSGLISIIALVFGFYFSLTNLFQPIENYLQLFAMDKITLFANFGISLIILITCFIHIGRMNKPRKNQLFYILTALIVIGLYVSKFYTAIIEYMAGYFVMDIKYIVAIFVIVGIIIEYILFGAAEKIRGTELCYTE